MYGVKGLSQTSEERYSLFVLNTILGAGVSSRLFQEIREKRGLAYSIYSFIASYFDTDVWGVYAGVSRKKVREVLELILKEMYGLKDTLNELELQRAKNQLKGNIILGLESTSSRMNNIARQEIYHDRYYSPKEMMNKIDSITLNQIKDLSERIVQKELFSLTIYGPVQEDDIAGILDYRCSHCQSDNVTRKLPRFFCGVSEFTGNISGWFILKISPTFTIIS